MKQILFMTNIVILLFFLVFSTLEAPNLANAAVGSMTVTSHDASEEICTAEDFRVSGNFILTEDETPTGYSNGPSEYCDLNTQYKPFVAYPMTNRTHAWVSYAIDENEDRVISKVETDDRSVWTEMNKLLYFGLDIDVSRLDPGLHTLSIVFQDMFGYYCYRPTYSWSSYMTSQQGEIIDEFTITFRVLEEGGICCGDAHATLVEECGGEDNIALWDDESCSGECILFDEEKNLGKSECDETQPYTKNPVNFATGNKFITQRDVAIAGPGLPFEFHRYYNSQSEMDSSMGYGWTSAFSQFLSFEEGVINLHEDDGRKVPFYVNESGKFITSSGKMRSIELVGGIYVLTEPDGMKRSFSISGRLLRMEGRNGNTQMLQYENDQLVSIEDNFGRALRFTYVDGRLDTLQSPVGDMKYVHDANGNLKSVVNPDGTVKSFIYDDPIDIHNLTGIIDEKKIRSLTAEYDAMDRAVVSELAGGLNRVEVGYPDNLQRTIVDSLGNMTTYVLDSFDGVGRIISSSGPGCKACPPAGSSYTLNERMLVQNKTDGRGILTSYAYDAFGNRTSMIEAVGLPEEKTTTYMYDLNTNLLKSVTYPSVVLPGEKAVIARTHDAFGNIVSEMESGYSGENLVNLVTRSTYNLNGQLIHTDGPLEDVEDLYIFGYFPNEVSEGDNRGQLNRIQNPMGHVTSYTNYNSFGKPGTMIDPNGTASEFRYDDMGRVTGITRRDVTTQFEYDPAGHLVGVKSPVTGDVIYSYTPAGLLERIEDGLGNVILYIYDSEGNRLREEIKDPGGQLTKYVDLVYDLKNRVSEIIQPDATSTSYLYDAVGNIVSQTNGGGKSTLYAYDGLNRLHAITEPGDVVTMYSHDIGGNVSSVSDGENHITSYVHDDFGHGLQVSSPDAGAASYSYDVAGNVISRNNANGITAIYNYDALNRLVAVRYPDSTQDVLYSYDQGENGIGKLTGMKNSSGEYKYSYDALGNMTRNEATINGRVYVTRYHFDESGRLAGMTYPGGRSVSYVRDSIGNITAIETSLGGISEKILSGIRYLPYGPVQGAILGNGLEVNNQFDLAHRITGQIAGTVFGKSYGYDSAGNISGIVDSVIPENSQTLNYDALNRLTAENGGYDLREYKYDKVGNRLQRLKIDQFGDVRVQDYFYQPGSNILEQINNKTPREYDGAGKPLLVRNGKYGYLYNDRGRISSIAKFGEITASYLYNGIGQRIQRIKYKNDGTIRTFHYYYDDMGQLLGQVRYNNAGIKKQEKQFVWLGTMPVAQIVTKYKKDGCVRSSEIFYLHTDHLNTPRLATNTEQKIVWRWDGDAFGVTRPDGDPDDDGLKTFVPLRFPGQIASDGGLFYNYHRYYEPETGRYFTPDPIGLAGGLNLYGYVNNNPVSFIDPTGTFGVAGAIVGAATGAYGGFLSGIQSGNIGAGVIGGIAGAAVGGVVGAVMPQFSGVLGGMIGGATAGIFGGGAGGALATALDPCSSGQDISDAANRGMLYGGLTGTLGGAFGSGAASLGASGAAVDVSRAMFTNSVGMGLGLIR